MSNSRTLLSASAALLTLLLQAQAPDAFNYQAVVRTLSGHALAGHSTFTRFAIHQGTPGGTVVFDETHATTTNENGLINLQVGMGTPVTGTLSGVDWKNGPYFLEVALDTNSSGVFTSMGTQQLLSVPYALHAGSSNVPNGTAVGQTLHWTGTTWAADSAIFSDGKRFGIGITTPEAPLSIEKRSELYQKFENGDIPTSQDFAFSSSSQGHPGFSLDQGEAGARSSRLFIDAPTGMMGIGTTTPEAPLSIEKRSELYQKFENGDIPTSQDFAFSSSSQGHPGFSLDQGEAGARLSRLFIDAPTGMIGVGTTTPDAPLAIKNRDYLYERFQDGDIPTSQDFVFSSSSQGHSGFSLDQGEAGARLSRLFIDETSGMVGIGTTTPEAPLSVQASSTGAYVCLTSTTGAFDPTKWNIIQKTGAVRGFSIDDASSGSGFSRLFIEQSSQGNVGIGTTTPTEKLHLEASTSSGITGIKILNTATANSQGWKMGHLQATDERDGAFSFIEDGVTSYERLVIRPGGNVGIGQDIPDTKLHVSRPMSDPSSSLGLIEGTGIMTLGPMTDNVVADYRGIQARHGEFVGDVLNLTATTLNLQRVGGDILIHGDMDIDDPKRGVVTSNGWLGLGTITPAERVEIAGAIKIGTTSNDNDGTIRYTGSDFEGRKQGSWVSLTHGSFTDGFVQSSQPSSITYSPPASGRVGINEPLPYSTLHVSRSPADRQTLASLEPGSGIVMVGALSDNLVMDYQGIQARHLFGGTTSTVGVLHAQRLGGDLLIHGDASIPDDRKVVITDAGLIGVGKAPIERLDVNGAITIGSSLSSNEGTIRFTGTEFQGRSSGQWRSLGSEWQKVDNTDVIHYSSSTGHPKVGIGVDQPSAALHVRNTESSSTDDVVGAYFELIGSTLNYIEDRYLLGLKVYTSGSASGSSSGAQIDNSSSSTSSNAQHRVGLGINCSGTWSPNAGSKDIGLYVQGVSGQSAPESNLAAVLNGNVVIGDVTPGSSAVGTGGTNVLAIQSGSPPASMVSSLGMPNGGMQVYCSTAPDGTAVFSLMNGNGDVIKLYRGVPITTGDASSVDGTYDANEENVINNLRSRVNDLENSLKALGLLTP